MRPDAPAITTFRERHRKASTFWTHRTRERRTREARSSSRPRPHGSSAPGSATAVSGRVNESCIMLGVPSPRGERGRGESLSMLASRGKGGSIRRRRSHEGRGPWAGRATASGSRQPAEAASIRLSEALGIGGERGPTSRGRVSRRGLGAGDGRVGVMDGGGRPARFGQGAAVKLPEPGARPQAVLTGCPSFCCCCYPDALGRPLVPCLRLRLCLASIDTRGIYRGLMSHFYAEGTRDAESLQPSGRVPGYLSRDDHHEKLPGDARGFPTEGLVRRRKAYLRCRVPLARDTARDSSVLMRGGRTAGTHNITLRVDMCAGQRARASTILLSRPPSARFRLVHRSYRVVHGGGNRTQDTTGLDEPPGTISRKEGAVSVRPELSETPHRSELKSTGAVGGGSRSRSRSRRSLGYGVSSERPRAAPCHPARIIVSKATRG